MEDKLPEGFTRCESADCLYRLKKRKKAWRGENLEPDVGKELYILSHHSGGYRKYTLEAAGPLLEKIAKFVEMGIVYHRP